MAMRIVLEVVALKRFSYQYVIVRLKTVHMYTMFTFHYPSPIC